MPIIEIYPSRKSAAEKLNHLSGLVVSKLDILKNLVATILVPKSGELRHSRFNPEKLTSSNPEGKYKSVILRPIGTVVSERKNIEDDYWGETLSHIDLDPEMFTSESFENLDQFSHAEIIFEMHQVDNNKIEYRSRHPRNNSAHPKVGVFAQRGKNRPNKLGMTVVRMIQVSGTRLTVEGLDAINGSPVLDIKPYFKEFGPRGVVFQPDWPQDIMKHYFEIASK
jgi:tRNA-Thr(GGU) m(6)t(6)A37 methyltransferase TsaA